MLLLDMDPATHLYIQSKWKLPNHLSVLAGDKSQGYILMGLIQQQGRSLSLEHNLLEMQDSG